MLIVMIHLVSRRESFCSKHEYCRMPKYGFIDLNSMVVTPSLRTINNKIKKF